MRETRQVIIATSVMVAVFAAYEWAKTLLFPGMSITTSHLVTTLVAGMITAVTARYVIRRQTRLLEEQRHGNERLREALAATERGNNLLQSVLASIDEGLVIIDHAERVLLINDAARRLLGLGQRTVTRLADISLDLQTEARTHEAFTRVLTTGSRAEARVELTPGLNRRVLRLHTAPLQLDGAQIDGVVGAFIDITQLEKLEHIRQEFLTNVSHELRTPLASIAAYTETLIDGGIDDAENALRFLTTIQRNAERMRNLVNDISELSTIESGAVRLTFERLPLREVADEVFRGLAPRSEKHQVSLHNQVPEDCFVTADHRRLEQILTNLVDNAIKFNRQGGRVIVRAATETTADGEVQVVMRVRDTGPGIPPEHLPRVFERFYRVDKARSRDLGGTGLGLAIVKHLARAHGGEAWVTSEAGQGCEFVIRLPYRKTVGSGQQAVVSEAPVTIAS
ncbi:MAG TPA: ATP-binding protein [Blastocatellia bacterium]|nr:ATP-binding protein [Blastocatellia bacterium]